MGTGAHGLGIDAVLAAVVAAGDAGCLLTDFDGTLAPIVDDPTAAVAAPGAVDALGALAARVGVVGVVSGRTAAFLVQRLGPAGERLWRSGLYGLELARPGSGGAVEVAAEVAAEAAAHRASVDRVLEEAMAAAPVGVFVEQKGLALTLHYRTTPTARAWVEAFAAAAAARTDLVAHSAKASVELRPPVTLDKGSVVDGVTTLVAALVRAAQAPGPEPLAART